MIKQDYESNFLSQVNGLNIIGYELDLTNYSEVTKEITNQTAEIEDILSFDEYQNSIKAINEYFGINELVPIIGLLGGSMLAIGLKEYEGRILYIDFDFGIFDLEEDLKTITKRLYQPKK